MGLGPGKYARLLTLAYLHRLKQLILVAEWLLKQCGNISLLAGGKWKYMLHFPEFMDVCLMLLCYMWQGLIARDVSTSVIPHQHKTIYWRPDQMKKLDANVTLPLLSAILMQMDINVWENRCKSRDRWHSADGIVYRRPQPQTEVTDCLCGHLECVFGLLFISICMHNMWVNVYVYHVYIRRIRCILYMFNDMINIVNAHSESNIYLNISIVKGRRILSNIITYHYGSTKKEHWKLASLIHSRRPSQEGLRECRRPSDLSGCYVILPPRWSKIQEKTDILEVNQNVPQWIIENIIVNRYVIIFPSKTQKNNGH